MTSIMKQITLSNGVLIPTLGFGTYKIVDFQDAKTAIDAALTDGYRAFDTAELYKNESVLGEVFADCDTPRNELFITTKVSNDSQGYDQTLKSFDRSLKNLKLDYVDLYLVHWPLKDTFFETWKAVEKIYDNKLAKSIGVCNFQKSHLELLKTKANIKPMINQIEIHPYLIQQELIQYLRDEGIAIEAWSPLARGKINDEKILIEIANKYSKSPSQIVLRWHLQKEIIVIPKSSNPGRINQNTQLFDFALTETEMHQIDALNNGVRIGPDPDQVYKKNGF